MTRKTITCKQTFGWIILLLWSVKGLSLNNIILHTHYICTDKDRKQTKLTILQKTSKHKQGK